MSENKKILPAVAELYKEVGLMQKIDELTVLLNQPPKPEWVKIHPYIAGYKYLPIDKVEYLLKMIFKSYRIEITNQGESFNGVWVTVRVHYLNPVTDEWDFHDGIGAKELQVKKGSSPAQLENINNGALAMAFPIAKTVAIKDACDHFGRLFGSDLNRKDTMELTLNETLQQKTVVDEINETVAGVNKDVIPIAVEEMQVSDPVHVTKQPEFPPPVMMPHTEDDDF